MSGCSTSAGGERPGSSPQPCARASSAIAERIHRLGPIRFDAYVEAALYGPGGFFTSDDRGAGRRADFLTSPEVGPLFGAVVALALDAEWERLGRPDPFVVVEAGAGRGLLARSVLDARPCCQGALRYVAVERSSVLRSHAEQRLPVEPPATVLGPVVGGADDEAQVVAGQGPVVAVLPDLPAISVRGVVLANELLDNLPFRLLERREDHWSEVLVGLGGGDSDGGDGDGGDGDDVDGDHRLVEVVVDAPPDVAAEAARLAPKAAPGARLPIQREAVGWLGQALNLLDRGRVIVVDYADTTANLAARPWRDWARTYRDHRRGAHPLEQPGVQDVTCEVAVDQLVRLRPLVGDRSQAEWLAHHGIGGLVEDARAMWWQRAHLGDLSALAARSRIGEADALTDPGGLGAFRVLEWEVER
ncbi:MAG: SAM-dependent methyltransferase [Acidimicrobiales bacterium]